MSRLCRRRPVVRLLDGGREDGGEWRAYTCEGEFADAEADRDETGDDGHFDSV